jgi:trans-2,3-dihydro-3-hydroxyanthranilate isomerase
MKEFHFVTCDVFTDSMFSGNQLAVLTDARGLDDATMLSIAREFNFAETTFVTPPTEARHTARVRIFTPGREMPFAGHPTIGTAFVLASTAIGQDADEMVLEENVGPVPVRVDRDGSRVMRCSLTAPRAPERIGVDVPSSAALAELLGLAAAEIAAPAEVWSCGLPFLVVPIDSRRSLDGAQLNLACWRRLLSNFVALEVYPVTQIDESTVRVRMFAPAAGVAEDAATGSAAAALAGWLIQQAPDPSGTRRWTVLQGESVGRPSRIELEADVRDGAVQAVRVGGASVMVSEGTLRL